MLKNEHALTSTVASELAAFRSAMEHEGYYLMPSVVAPELITRLHADLPHHQERCRAMRARNARHARAQRIGQIGRAHV